MLCVHPKCISTFRSGIGHTALIYHVHLSYAPCASFVYIRISFVDHVPPCDVPCAPSRICVFQFWINTTVCTQLQAWAWLHAGPRL